MIKEGDLIRYKEFPHEELHKSRMTGLVVSESYTDRRRMDLHLIDVVWGNDRGRSYPAGIVCQEFVDELEVVDA